jgi:hypothetical protein
VNRKVVIIVSLLLFLFAAGTAAAGGWVVITIEDLPGEFHAGSPQALSFMVRQHGQTPTAGLSPILEATNRATGESIRLEAEETAKTGRYTVRLEFPSEGQWAWSIRAAPFNQTVTFEPVNVLAQGGTPAPVNPSPATGPLGRVFFWAGLSLLAAAVLLIIAGQRRQALPAPATGD